MKLKWIINTTAIALLVVVALLGLASHDSAVAAQDEGSKIEGLLQERFTTDGNADYIVRFTEQADLSAAYAMDWDARGNFVYNSLREMADRSQVNAKAILDTDGLKYQTFIAGNELYVWSGNLTNASALAALPEVDYIRATRTYQVDPVTVVKPFDKLSWAGDFLSSDLLTTVNAAPNGLAWGITDTKADQFWNAYGVRGDGIVVANIDTGVDWTHDALQANYKCAANPSDPACWLNPGTQECTGPSGGPCDSWTGTWHGTHVMGTQAGDDDPTLQWNVGMAPNSQWIACMGCPNGSCPDFDLNSCADWLLHPGGDPNNRPDVVNNSWGGGGGSTFYLAKVQAWVAAGIFPAFSAGNSGSGCATLGSPGDYQESFGTAAHDVSRNIASFSSRGASAFGHDPYTKPNISSPGVAVMSAMPGNQWQTMSGTSMASPHTAGAVALLWSCNPALGGHIDLTFQLLQNNTDAAPAGNCGTPPDGQGNYTFGYGYLDVLKAGETSCGSFEVGALDGYVFDSDGLPIEGASVSPVPAPGGKEGNQVEAITDPTGYYTMTLVTGTYNVTASKVNYLPQTINNVVVNAGEVTSQNFTLEMLTGAWIQIPWPTSCANLNLTRYDGEYYPANGLVYFLGGRSDTSTIGDIYSYNPVSNTCADTGVNMPTPISNYTANLVNNGTHDVLCTFGGRTSTGATTLNVQCFDPIAGTATVVAQLPAGYTGFTPGAQVVLNNKVYVFGGFNSLAAPYETNRTDRFDPLTNTFTQLGNLSMARSYIDAAVVDGQIYAFGGTVYDGLNLNAQTRTEKMADPEGAGTWDNAAVAELPTATAEGRTYGFDTNSGYELAGKVVIAGGGQWPADIAEAFTYDVATDTYDYNFADLQTTRRDQAGFFLPATATEPGVMFVFGGRSGADTPPYASPEYYEVPKVQADLSLTKSGPASVHFGEEFSYSLVVSNLGTSDATGVEVVDTLPAGVTFVSASAGCTNDAGVVTCVVGNLADGGEVTLTITVTAPTVETTLTNTALVSGDQPDPNTENNSASFDTVVVSPIVNFYLPLVMRAPAR